MEERLSRTAINSNQSTFNKVKPGEINDKKVRRINADNFVKID